MLFYLKKFAAWEILGAAAMAVFSIGMAYYFDIPMPFHLTPFDFIKGLLGAGILTMWTLGIQQGYAWAKGRDYANSLTRNLASHFRNPSVAQLLGAGLAAAGEELLFRGLIQGKWGLVAGSVAFMIAHLGKKDIRIIGYWSIFQGVWLGLFYLYAGNLLVPIVAHVFFDVGAMVHFKRLMARPATEYSS